MYVKLDDKGKLNLQMSYGCWSSDLKEGNYSPWSSEPNYHKGYKYETETKSQCEILW